MIIKKMMNKKTLRPTQYAISSEQLNNLIETVFNAYENIKAISGESQIIGVSPKGLLSGSVFASYGDDLRLQPSIQRKLSVDLKKQLYLDGIVDANLEGNNFFFDTNPSPDDLSSFSDNYVSKVNELKLVINDELDELANGAKDLINSYIYRLSDLNKAVKSKDFQSVVEVLEKFDHDENWFYQVETKPVYEVGQHLLDFANKYLDRGVIGVEPIYKSLSSSLNQSLVLKPRSFWNYVVPDQTYKGKIKPELVAKDLLLE